MTASDQLLHTTILIKCVGQSGENSSGTGFMFSFFKQGDTTFPALITNRHVIEGAAKGILKFTLAKSDGTPDIGKSIEFTLDNFSALWIRHPNPLVDLAIFPLGDALTSLRTQGFNLYTVFTDQSFVPTDDVLKALTPLEDVLIVGYPDGVSDTVNNIPIFRRGITATPANIAFNGSREFLVDAAIFPGSSGSPTFIFNQGSYPTRDGGLQIGSRLILIGVVYAVASYTSNGDIVIVPAPTQAKAFSVTQIPINLGKCINAQRILDFEPLLVAQGFKPPTGYVMRVEQPQP